MLYFIALFIFFILVIGLLFAKDSFINTELYNYNRKIKDYWLDPVVSTHFHHHHDG